MKSLLRVTILAVCVAAMPLGVAFATRSLAPPVGGRPRLLLAFGVPYEAEGSSRVHHGLDLGAPARAEVAAAGAGTVTFAGRLPAGEGAETRGVTVQTADGLKVTVLPLDTTAVHTGEVVAAGDRLGTLAAHGDASSAEPHVHLSVRQGETYLDPASLLTGLTEAPAPPPAETPAPAPHPAPAPRAAPGAAAVAAHGLGHAPASPAAAPAPCAAAGVAAHALGAGTSVPGASKVGLGSLNAAPAGATHAVVHGVAAGAGGVSAGAARSTTARPAAEASSLFDRARAALASARKLATYAAEALVALAFLWPAWRRRPDVSAFGAEPAAVRARI